MTITLNGTSGIVNDATDLNYTGTLTGGTGVVNIGSGQVYKDASGNVGFGTASPGAKVHASVTDGTYPLAVSGTTKGMRFETNANESRILGVDNSLNGSYQPLMLGGSTLILASSGNTERARIDSSGNLLVGKTSSDDSVQGVNVNAGSSIEITSANSGTQYPVAFYRAGSGAAVGFISTSTSNTTSYATSSDYRLKEDITPMTGALARNAMLEPVVYRWKADGSWGEGFIADKLQGPFPAAVTGEKDAVDAEGKPVYQGIGTGPLDGHFAACVNELQAIITALTTRITALEAANV